MTLQAQKLYPFPSKIDDMEDVREYLKSLYVAIVEGGTDMTEDLEYAFQDNWAFKTITGITNDVVADQKGDTLTLAKAGPLTIVGTAATDTITWTWAHLGIESLTDPNADRIAFYDNSEEAFKWLAVGNSIAITVTTLDTIQDIRTSASPTFTGLTLSGKVDADYAEATAATNETRYYDYTVVMTADPAANAEISCGYFALNKTGGANGVYILNGLEGVARSSYADEAGTFRGVYGRTYTSAGTTASMRTAIGGEFSARAGYSGGTDCVAEGGTAFVGSRIWMAPYFTSGSLSNINNFWGLWIYGEHAAQRNADAAIKIGSAGGGFTVDLELQSGETIKNTTNGVIDFSSANLVTLGTLGCGNVTGGTYNALTLAAVTTGFTIAGGTTPKTLTMNDDFNVSTQLTAIGNNTTHRGSVGTDHGYIDQDLQVTASPVFVTAKLSGLTDGYVPYHVADATGLANSGMFWDSGNNRVGIDEATPLSKIHATETVGGANRIVRLYGTATIGALNFYDMGIYTYDGAAVTATAIFGATSSTTTYGIYKGSAAYFTGQKDGGVVIGAVHANGNIRFATGGEAAANEKMRIGSDGHIDIYDWDDSTMREVDFGADDSGGSGYKVLRVPN